MTKTAENVSIALHHGVNAEHQLYRLKRGTLLRIVPGSSLLGRNVALYCNYPVTGEKGSNASHFTFSIHRFHHNLLSEKAEFIREQYLHLNWFSKDGKKLSDGLHPFAQITDLDTHCEIEVTRSGTFHFYFIYDDK